MAHLPPASVSDSPCSEPALPALTLASYPVPPIQTVLKSQPDLVDRYQVFCTIEDK